MKRMMGRWRWLLAAAWLPATAAGAQVGTGTAATPAGNPDVTASAATGAQPGQADSPNATAQGEIIVTAERRGVSAQRLPVSVVALSGEALKDRAVTDVSNLQTQVPSLSFVNTGFTPFINIRGVGLSESAPNQTDGIAVHLDGAYVAREFTIADAFFDLDHVEVLRGPQGTYVGQNAIGGAIFINTRAPTLNQSDGFVEGTIASYARVEVGAGVDIPVADTLAVRLSGNFERRSSYYRNDGIPGDAPGDRGNHPGNLIRGLGRAQLLWKPSDRLKARVIYQYSDRQTDGTTFKQFQNGDQFTRSRTLDYDFPQTINTSYNRITGIVDWEATDFFRVHAVSAYQRTHQYFTTDSDLTNPFTSPTVAQGAVKNDLHDHYTTNEIDLVSTSGGPFQWTVGGTMLDYAQHFTFSSVTYNTPAFPATQPDFTGGLYLNFKTYRRNQAVFGELGYKLTPTLELRAGARYNWDQVGIRGSSYLSPPLAAPLGGPKGLVKVPAGPNEPNYSAATGRVLVNWTPSPDELVYATVSRGYKPGGWTPAIGGTANPTERYGAEKVTNYEIGIKSSLFDRMLRTSISGFYMTYKGYQATVATDPTNPATTVTQNVQGTTIKGVEAQATLSLHGFTLDGGISVLDAKYGNLGIFVPINQLGFNNPSVITAANLDGRTINYAPKFSANGSIGYAFDLPGGTLTPRLQTYHVSGQWTNFYHADFQRIPGYTTVDFHLTYASARGWKLDAYLTNLLDNHYISAVNSTNYLYIGSYTLGAPREVGARLSYSF